VTYAFLIDGTDTEGRETIDKALAGGQVDKKTKARRERQAIASLTNIPGVAR
jgi:hypothetical protein